MKDSGCQDLIFSHQEIKSMENLTQESIKAHFMIKKTFPYSTIEQGVSTIIPAMDKAERNKNAKAQDQ